MSNDQECVRSYGASSWLAAVLTLSAACALPDLRVAGHSPDAGQSPRDMGIHGDGAPGTRTDPETRSGDAGVKMASDGSDAASPGASSGQAGDAAEPALVGGSGGNASGSLSTQLFALGAACTHGSDCSSMACVDGVCCASTVCSSCQRCGGDGQCQAVRNGNADNCTNGSCNGDGHCVLTMGENCSSASDCSSNQCANGVCCSTDCTGVCSGCDLQAHPGICSPVGDVDNPGRCDGNRTCFNGDCVDLDLNVVGSSPGNFLSFGGHWAARIAQVFTIQNAGKLLEVRMDVQCSPLEIMKLSAAIVRVDADGAPTAPQLASLETKPRPLRTGTTSTGTDSTSFVAQPLGVSAGDKLAVVVDGSNVPSGCGISEASGNVYAGGEAWEQNTGDDWRSYPESDFWMRLIVQH